MSRTDNNNLLLEKIENRLQRIANVLLLNASFIDYPGLLNGKMGIAIFFYHYSRYTKNKIYEEYAGELIDEIYEEINTSTSVNFENGLTGIGWGIEYLVKNKFVQADTDEALAEIDNAVYKHRLNNPILISSGDDLFGYGFYHVARILGHKIDDDDLNTLIKKYHLIFLVDECERILEQKSYIRFNIETLSIDTVNSFIWFLLEIQKLAIFPVKVEKIFHSVPDYIEKGNQELSDKAGHALMLLLAEKTMDSVKDNSLRDHIKRIIEKMDGEKVHGGQPYETDVSDFIKNTWQQIIYAPYYSNSLYSELSFKALFKVIEDEENWNGRLNELTIDSLGLTGLAGLGLGLFNLLDNKQQVQFKGFKGQSAGLKLKFLPD